MIASYLRSVGAVAVAALVLVACGSHSEPSAASPTASGVVGQGPMARTVPVQLQFTAKTLDGQDFRGESLLGRPAVLWFWAPWCPTCQGEAHGVSEVAVSHPTVTFVGVGGLDQVPAMREFVDRYSVNGFTQLADTDGSVWAKFGVTQQPAYAFVRSDGGIDVVKGRVSEADLTERVTALANQ